MASSEKSSRAVVMPLIRFVLTILPAIGLFVAALTVWLSLLLDSVIWACVVIGASFLVVATILYLIWLRGAVKRIQEQMATIYETARLFRSGLDWIGEKIAKFWS
jgi:uncharacterized protein (DUF983 family)